MILFCSIGTSAALICMKVTTPGYEASIGRGSPRFWDWLYIEDGFINWSCRLIGNVCVGEGSD